jgi:hypothetical protein
MSNEKNITSNEENITRNDKNMTSYCLDIFDKLNKKSNDEEWQITYNEYLPDWEQNYTKYLEWLSQQPPNPYRDPDGKDAKAWNYYQNLTAFLNAQEDFYQKQNRQKQNRLKKWTYEFQTDKVPYGIAVKENKKALLFYLKSDQFGFSAPSVDKNHIYDVYLEKSDDKASAINNIKEWILRTRTLGGGLLWPMEQNEDGKWIANPQINTMRGGSKTYKSKYYIEDRIDLTLWEIKHYLDFNSEKKGQKYCEEYKGDILCGCMKKSPNLRKWLDHFQDFKTYVEFFCFQDFCTESEKSYKPYNMLQWRYANIDTFDESYDKADKKNSIYYNVFSEVAQKNLNPDAAFSEATENMLKTLSQKIINRTLKMEEIRKENI